MQELFLRNFSSVHVHYVPCEDFRTLGTPDIILKQHERLFHRIKNDSERVQIEREKAWTKFDAKQMAILFNYVFKHLSSQSDEPFDFSVCRRQVDVPETMEGHLSEFLQRSLEKNVKQNFSYASKVIA
jgi:hypothetical protein